METDQFAEFAAAVVRQLPRDCDPTTAQGWIINQSALASTLRQALLPPVAFELYLHDKQKNGGWIKGFDLEKHLEETKLIDRCFSLEDELVRGWLANPSTYPEEFKGKAIFLWKSRRTSGDLRLVAYLLWNDGHVIVIWRWLEDGWYGSDPALLASS